MPSAAVIQEKKGGGKDSESISGRNTPEVDSELDKNIELIKIESEFITSEDCAKKNHKFSHSHTVVFSSPEYFINTVNAKISTHPVVSSSNTICEGTTFSMKNDAEKKKVDLTIAPVL